MECARFTPPPPALPPYHDPGKDHIVSLPTVNHPNIIPMLSSRVLQWPLRLGWTLIYGLIPGLRLFPTSQIYLRCFQYSTPSKKPFYVVSVSSFYMWSRIMRSLLIQLMYTSRIIIPCLLTCKHFIVTISSNHTLLASFRDLIQSFYRAYRFRCNTNAK